MASIRCYHCKGSHESVSEVRECATVPAASATVSAFDANDRRTAGGGKLTTEKQLNFLRSLIARKDISRIEDELPRDEMLPELDRRAASMLIDMLMGMSDKPREAVTSSKPAGTHLPDVPAGHYAIPGNDDNEEHDIRFYRVDRPTEGRWAGRTFVKVASSNEWFKIGRAETERVLLEIAMDPEAARMLYAKELERCTRCNRKLTDKSSRERGLGPECASK